MIENKRKTLEEALAGHDPVATGQSVQALPPTTDFASSLSLTFHLLGELQRRGCTIAYNERKNKVGVGPAELVDAELEKRIKKCQPFLRNILRWAKPPVIVALLTFWLRHNKNASVANHLTECLRALQHMVSGEDNDRDENERMALELLLKEGVKEIDQLLV